MTYAAPQQVDGQNDAHQREKDSEKNSEGLLEAVAAALQAIERDAEESQATKENDGASHHGIGPLGVVGTTKHIDLHGPSNRTSDTASAAVEERRRLMGKAPVIIADTHTLRSGATSPNNSSDEKIRRGRFIRPTPSPTSDESPECIQRAGTPATNREYSLGALVGGRKLNKGHERDTRKHVSYVGRQHTSHARQDHEGKGPHGISKEVAIRQKQQRLDHNMPERTQRIKREAVPCRRTYLLWCSTTVFGGIG